MYKTANVFLSQKRPFNVKRLTLTLRRPVINLFPVNGNVSYVTSGSVYGKVVKLVVTAFATTAIDNHNNNKINKNVILTASYNE